MAVVVSAMGGKPKVTDLLLKCVTLAAAGDLDGSEVKDHRMDVLPRRSAKRVLLFIYLLICLYVTHSFLRFDGVGPMKDTSVMTLQTRSRGTLYRGAVLSYDSCFELCMLL